ncbi:TolB family protein [Natronospora cellulosivora (SeqCode)]
MKKLFYLVLIIFLLFIFIQPLSANTNWQTMKTDHFMVLYQRGYEEVATEALAILEYYRPDLEEVFGNELKSVPVLIEDTGSANGYADPFNYRSSLFTSYPPISSSLSGENWLALVAVHEYVHMLSLSSTGGSVENFQRIFGNAFMPNIVLNAWITEGIAVYYESMFSPYSGRLNEGYYDAYIGALVAEDKLPSIVDASFFPNKYPGRSAAYLYGAQFFRFLAEEYGEEKLGEFFAVNGSSMESFASLFFPAIGIDRSASKVFDKTLPELWREWHGYEKDRFADFKMEGERLTYHGWNASQSRWHNEKIYFQRNYPLIAGSINYNRYQNEIVAYKPVTGETEIIIRDLYATGDSLHFLNNSLYYTSYKTRTGFANTSFARLGRVKELNVYNLESEKKEVLFEDSLRAFLPLSEEEILYAKDRKGQFGSELWLYSRGLEKKELLYTFDYLIHEMLLYEDKIITAASERNRNSNIYELSLASGEFTEILGSPFIEARISIAGDKLFFTSNQGSMYRAYSYDLKEGNTYKLTENGFAASPLYDSENNRLYYFGLTVDGYDLFTQEAKFEEYSLKTVDYTPVQELPLNLEAMDIQVTHGGYIDNLKTLAPRNFFPVIYFTEEDFSIGALVQGSDPLNHFNYMGELAYNIRKNSPEYAFNINSSFFAPLDMNLSGRNNSFDNQHSIDISYPLASHIDGIDNLLVGNTFSVYDWEECLTQAYLSLGFAYPKSNLNINLSALMYDDNKKGYTINIGASHYLFNGNLFASIRHERYQKLITRRDLIRGFDEDIDFRQLERASLDYKKALFSIEKGLWNPSIYLHDLYGTAFVNGIRVDNDEVFYSYGVEIELTNQIGTYYSPLIGSNYLRFVRDNEGDNKIQFGMKITL